jgi:large subunit ribosomal protein L25
VKEISLEAKTRKGVGTSLVKKLREKGIIPAVVYGVGEETIPLEVDSKTFLSILRSGMGENVIINLNIDQDKTKTKKVLIREIQHDPIWGNILHIDFQHISMEKKIIVRVPVHLIGAAIGVSEGGILQHAMRDLEVECLPLEIPEKIEVEVSHLKIGDAVHVREVKLEKGTILSDADSSVVSVVPPTVFKEAEVKVAEEAVAEPELVGEKKEGEEAEEGEETKGEKKEAGAEKKTGAEKKEEKAGAPSGKEGKKEERK